MEKLELKDFVAAIVLAFTVWLVGGIAIGFLGALIGFGKDYFFAFSWLLVIAIPMFYLFKRARR